MIGFSGAFSRKACRDRLPLTKGSMPFMVGQGWCEIILAIRVFIRNHFNMEKDKGMR
jgi:hypothetical protein